MRTLFVCVGQAIVSNGIKGLLGELPFGGFLYDVAADAWGRWRAKRKDVEMREELRQVAQQVAVQEIRQLAAAVSEQVAAEQPPEVRRALTAYLTLLPSSIRQSFKRPDDPTGTTVPAAFALARPEDLLMLLPAQPPRFQPGERPAALGGWELVDLLGVGGFGEVWLAHNVSFPDIRAAVKFCLDPAARQRFLQHEGRLVQRVMREQSKLKTPEQGDGIVPLQDANLDAEPPWLRYEYIEGNDLSRVGALLVWAAAAGAHKRATLVIRRLAAVVGQFHHLGEPIVHRDLKPANVLVQRRADGKGALRICDFGISQVASRQALEQSRRSTPSQNLGQTLRGAHTPLYASPQQKLMRDPDVRDDVFALGVMWYQLLLGDLTLERPAGKWRKRVVSLQMDDVLLDLLESCSDDDPAERPANAAELAERLTGKSPPPPPPPPPAQHKPGSILMLSILPNIDMKFAWIPPGLFLMGGNGQKAHPQHRVTISKGFWMGIFPVTQAQWQAVMAYNPSNFPGPDRPVERVSWDDCQEFCQKMAELTGKSIRLPTEAEWEYAARAGTTSEYYSGNGEDALKKVGWYNSNSENQTHAVGEKKSPNPWGLHDVHGNVWEWCQDLYAPLDSANTKDPVNLNNGDARVLRGGSWYGKSVYCRAACRDWNAPATRDADYGFRVCFRLD